MLNNGKKPEKLNDVWQQRREWVNGVKALNRKRERFKVEQEQ